MFAGIVCCLLSFTGCGPGSGLDEVVLDNGLTVVLKHDPSTPIVSVLMRVKAGSINETVQTQSLSRLVEKLLFRQTPASRGRGPLLPRHRG